MKNENVRELFFSHTPEIKRGYINCGDWIENNSYIIYINNEFKLLSNI